MNANQFSKLLKRVDYQTSMNPCLRFGQCLFNELEKDFPLVSSTLRGSSLDPFYKASKADCELILSYLWERCA